MPIEIPAVVIDRLPVYARALNYLEEQGRDVVSSQELGNVLALAPQSADPSYWPFWGRAVVTTSGARAGAAPDPGSTSGR